MSGPTDPAAALLADLRNKSKNADWAGLMVRVKNEPLLALVASASAALNRPWWRRCFGPTETSPDLLCCQSCVAQHDDGSDLTHDGSCEYAALDAALDALAKLSSRDDAAER